MKPEDILNDNKSGSTIILHNLITLIKENYAELKFDFPAVQKLIEEVQKTHPFMAVFHNLIGHLKSHPDIPLESAMDKYTQKLQDIFRRTIRNGVKVMEQYHGIATISRSTAVEQVLQGLSSEKHIYHILESRPMLEGISLAENLCNQGYKVSLWVDSAAARAVEESQAVIFGADVICRKGVVNKIGSLPLTLLAKRKSKPVYVIADSSKENPDFNYNPILDKHPAAEITTTEAAINVKNPYFELVPLNLIDFRINEEGVKHFRN